MGYGNGTTQHWRYYGQETQNWGQQYYGRLRQTCVITTAATCPDDDRDGAATKLSLHYWYDADGVRAADHRPPTAVCGMIGGQWSAVTRS